MLSKDAPIDLKKPALERMLEDASESEVAVHFGLTSDHP